MGKIAMVLLYHILPVLFTHSSGALTGIPSNGNDSEFIEVPTMRINYYIMGKGEVDKEVIMDIELNMNYLNEEFEGKIKFTNEYYYFDNQKAYLPDIRQALLDFNDEWVNSLVEPLEIKGSLNVFVFDTYTEKHLNASLMGFTPLLPNKQEDYGLISPEFDRMFIAYEGLKKMSTLVHEVGHFLGLKHTWEMGELKKKILGINTKSDELDNHMSYHHTVNKFTEQQLEEMRLYALKYRSYLLEETEWISYNN